MIFLLGGTSDAPPIARRLADLGHRVLMSQATDTPLVMEPHPLVELRRGPLDEETLASLLCQRAIRAVVDAAHPYAATIHAVARRAAQSQGIPYFRFERPGAIAPDAAGVAFAADHASAAVLAFSFGQSVLTTIGTRNLSHYAAASQRTGTPLFARVLDVPESAAECLALKIPAERILQGRGPFSVEDNRRAIRRHGIGVLVTKDSGHAGGVAEKVAAAQAEGCRVVVVRRPEAPSDGAITDIETLVAVIKNIA